MNAETLCQRSAAYALDALGRVTDADLDRPTPCPGWDLHVALGSGIPVPEEHAAAVLDLATRLVGDEARAAFFAPVVDPGADATASDRLVAFLGRDLSLPAIR